MRFRTSFRFDPTVRRVLLGVTALSLVACVRRAETKTVRSEGTLGSTVELTQQVVTALGYRADPADVTSEKSVVVAAWQEYPKGHSGAGIYRRRAVVVLDEKAATRKHPAVIDATARIDVAKCVWSGGQASCNLVDRHFEEDERDLDALAARLLMAYQRGNVPSTLSKTTAPASSVHVQRPSEETTVVVTRPEDLSPTPSSKAPVPSAVVPAPVPSSSAPTQK